MDYYTGEVKEVFRKCYSADPESPRAKVNCYGANDVTEGVAIMWKEGVDVSITGNSTNPTRFQHRLPEPIRRNALRRERNISPLPPAAAPAVPFIPTTWRQAPLPTA